MSTSFEITEYCDEAGRTARSLTRSNSGGVDISEHRRVEGARPDWAESPDDPFDTTRSRVDRVRHAAKANALQVKRAWEQVRATREHPLAGTPSIEPEESFYHAVLAIYARWFAENETPFPNLPPLPFTSVQSMDESPGGPPLVVKAKEVRRLLSISASRLDDLVSEGRLVPVRYVDGGDRSFTRQSVEDFVDELARAGYRR